MKEAKALASVAEYSNGSKEVREAVWIKLINLLKDMDVYVARVEEILKEIFYIDKQMAFIGDHGQLIYCRNRRP